MSRAPATFSPVAVAAMLGVGFACFVAFVVVLGFAGGPNQADGGAHAASRSAVGFAGVVQLLQDSGTPVTVSRAAAYSGAPAASLLVLTPEAASRGPATMPDMAADTVLIVLPKWHTIRQSDHPGWVREDGLLPDSQVLSVLPRDWKRLRLNRRKEGDEPKLRATAPLSDVPSIAHVRQLQTLTAPGWTAVLRTPDGGVVLGQPDEDSPYVLADPDLLNDLALADLAGAQGAIAIISALSDGKPVAFDISLNGFGRSRDPLRLILEPPLLGATLCAVATAVLIGLLSARRFGPVRRTERALDLGKRALADNSASLIARAGRQPRMARPYAELTRSLAARLTGAPRRLTPDELDAYLDRAAAIRAVPGQDRFTALLAEADAVRDRAGLMRLARRLHSWRMGFVHGHR